MLLLYVGLFSVLITLLYVCFMFLHPPLFMMLHSIKYFIHTVRTNLNPITFTEGEAGVKLVCVINIVLG